MEKFISYSGLPIKSGGAHQISNKAPLSIYRAMLGFMEHMTTNHEPHYTQVLLKGGGFKAWWLLLKQFGLPGISFDNGQLEWQWYIKPEQVEKAIELGEIHANVIVGIMWRFTFVDPVSKIVIPGQYMIPEIDSRLFNSQAYLRLGQKNTLSLWFTLPFESLDHYACDYLSQLGSHLPVKLSPNHWKIWKPSKSGSYVDRKLDVSSVL